MDHCLVDNWLYSYVGVSSIFQGRMITISNLEALWAEKEKNTVVDEITK